MSLSTSFATFIEKVSNRFSCLEFTVTYWCLLFFVQVPRNFIFTTSSSHLISFLRLYTLLTGFMGYRDGFSCRRSILTPTGRGV